MHKRFRTVLGVAIPLLTLTGLLFAQIIFSTVAHAAPTVTLSCRGRIPWGTCPQTVQYDAFGFTQNQPNPSDIEVQIRDVPNEASNRWNFNNSATHFISVGNLSGGGPPWRNNENFSITVAPNRQLGPGTDRSGTITIFSPGFYFGPQSITIEQAEGSCASVIMGEMGGLFGDTMSCVTPAGSRQVLIDETINFNGYGETGAFTFWRGSAETSGSFTVPPACSSWLSASGSSLVAAPNDTPDAGGNILTRTCTVTFDTTSLVIRQIPATEEIGPPGGPNGPGGETEGNEITCDLGPLGWALCPLITGTDSMLGGIYGWIEDNFLQVTLAFYDTDSGTYQAWRVFRDIANVLFVIFFLVVIFSQVTSYGVSNYGIKKMLPEIVIAAILINLSFFIAQGMIDLSNIVGYQIKDLLEGIAGSLVQYGDLSLPEGTSGLFYSLLTMLGVGGAAALITTVLTGGLGALLAAAILFLLAALIAILMLFLLLVVRQVGVIILVVLAPLAFAARILPGTAGLFKTWWRMFTTLLIVYPVAGLVIGAGKLAGVIIITSAGVTEIEGTANVISHAVFGSILGAALPGPLSTFGAVAFGNVFAIVAMIAMIAPYFAVITIIKGSLSGLGRVGAFVTGKTIGDKGVGKKLNNYSKETVDKGGKAIGEKFGYTARRQAKMETAKANANKKASERAARGKGAIGKMQEAKHSAEQYQTDAAMASVGQYKGDDKKLRKISNKNAKKYGIGPDGQPTVNFAPGSYEEHQQMQARTAVLQQEAKQSKQIDEQYDSMLSPGDVYGSVYDTDAAGGSGKAEGLKLTGNAQTDALRIERAIASMTKKGDIEKATDLTRAYTASNLYAGENSVAGSRYAKKAGTTPGSTIDKTATKHRQQRLSGVLATGDVKKDAAHLHAYGWQTGKALAQGNETAFTLDDLAAGSAKRTTTPAGGGAPVTTALDSLGTTMQAKYDAATVASQDKDTYKYLSSTGSANFSAKQYASALTSGASADKIKTMNTALQSDAKLSAEVPRQIDANQLGKVDDTTFNIMRENAALQVAAATKKKGSALSTTERKAVLDGTSAPAFFSDADRQAVLNGTTTYLSGTERAAVKAAALNPTAPTTIAGFSGASDMRAAMRDTFSEAYSQASVVGSRAADSWSSARRSALGI